MNDYSFPRYGLVRIHQILAPKGPIPVSRAGFYAACKAGKAPKPYRIGKHIAAWDAAEIREFIETIKSGGTWASKE